jgi:hypothetical protein
MYIFRRGPFSYANVTATLALLFAMSGGALAANHYLISSTKQINPSVLMKLKGSTGSWALESANGSVAVDGFANQGVWLQGAGGPACSFSGYLVQE